MARRGCGVSLTGGGKAIRKMILTLLLCVGCVDPLAGDLGDAGGTSQDSVPACLESQTRCVGQSYEHCVGGTFKEWRRCAANMVCVGNRGCAICDPFRGTTCVGNDIYTCVNQGVIGVKLRSCLGQTCAKGRCLAAKCAPGARLIYVVDSEGNFLSFDPSKKSNHFTLIKKLSCPAGKPLQGYWPPATPFSMSVDRSAWAWVLYKSGEIFWVNTKDGACKASDFPLGQKGWALFGMGFVSDRQGSAGEKLYVARDLRDISDPIELGYLDPSTLKVKVVGTMPKAWHSGELSGTGEGALYAFHPDKVGIVNRVDPLTAKILKTWKLPPPVDPVGAYAFAHWGGKFYLFTSSISGKYKVSRVLRLDPKTGKVITFLPDIPYRVVGAGVSTCAPVIG